jgi:CO/xanthine dehydrogenase FAD-binding subunit
LRPFAYARPKTLDETFALLGRYGPDAKLLAGGTDVVAQMRIGRVAPHIVIDLKKIAGLSSAIVQVDSRLRIGALAIMTDLIGDERVRRHFPALVESASVVGSVQIRNRATLAGNICNASPAADTAPALLAYGAIVNMTGASGARSLPLAEFFAGPGRTVLSGAEIVESIDLPVPSAGVGAAFGRVTRRRGVDLATINLCCLAQASGEARFAFGAVGPRPFIVKDDSGVLTDPTTSANDRDAVLRRLVAHAQPISDVRGGADYRRAMLLVMSRRALRTALDRMQSNGERG